jgi:PhzF family phenazine biosynthesis protein
MKRPFAQVDVFTAAPLLGNPLAVVRDAAALSDGEMQAIARWTNLSETTFLLPPTDPAADYRVRIFTPHGELPFAGHPTLGTCHVWLASGGQPKTRGLAMQECTVGLVRVRCDGPRLEFAAPPLRRTGPLEPALLEKIRTALSLAPADIVHHQWVDNGPGWCAVMLESAAAVRALQPDWPGLTGLRLGVVGPHAAGGDAEFELRALLGDGRFEDPVTGSLNASVAQWLMAAGKAPARYVATQGHALGRAGRVHVERIGDTVWVGGDVAECIRGEVSL